MTTIFINILAFGTLLSSIFSITSKNPVISVIFLISTFVQSALYLILIGINFVGISYIVIYVGAIAVLFLFVIMMINIKLSDILETGSQYTKNLPLALSIGSIFLYEIFTVMPFTFNNVSAISGLLDLLTKFNTLFLNSEISTYSNLSSSLIGKGDVIHTTLNPGIADTSFTSFLQIQAIGHILYTLGALWLIITSLIFLLALAAPLFISSKNT